METIFWEKNIPVLSIIASSFPDGISEAHQRLHALVPFSHERKYFGISWGQNDGIVYKAAAEILNTDNGNTFGCEIFTIKKGKYVSETVTDFMNNVPAIGKTFQQLLSHPGLDPNGYCLEWYSGRDVKCMVKLSN